MRITNYDSASGAVTTEVDWQYSVTSLTAFTMLYTSSICLRKYNGESM